MSGVTDHAMFGTPKSNDDIRRQRGRAFYRLALALEHAEQCASDLRIEITGPFGMNRPDLADDVDRTIIALTKLHAWACDAAKSTPPTEGQQQ